MLLPTDHHLCYCCCCMLLLLLLLLPTDHHLHLLLLLLQDPDAFVDDMRTMFDRLDPAYIQKYTGAVLKDMIDTLRQHSVRGGGGGGAVLKDIIDMLRQHQVRGGRRRSDCRAKGGAGFLSGRGQGLLASLLLPAHASCLPATACTRRLLLPPHPGCYCLPIQATCYCLLSLPATAP